ncbi:MAG: NusA-like transcription termination signal-binding factor [Candidatus Micrarchaeia archaeon]
MPLFKLSNEELRLLSLFERMTGTPAKDVVSDGHAIAFLIPAGLMGRAIGKKGASIQRVRNALGKPVVLFEHADSPEEFIRNLIAPAPAININIQEKNNMKTATVRIDPKYRGSVLGRGGERIKLAQALLQRHFGIALKLVSL